MARWLQLIYKVPRKPTSTRVYVWRKLKQLGALALQDATWVLPATARTQEQFQWLASEIVELGGEVTLWASDLVFEKSAASLEQQFTQPVEEAYRAILGDLKKRRRDLAALSRRYQQVVARDYFEVGLGLKVRGALLAARQNKSRGGK